MAKRGPAATPALTTLVGAGVAHTVHSYQIEEEGETYGESVAAALGVEPGRLFKTLVAVADGRPVVAIVPSSGRLSLRHLARLAGAKSAEMADPRDAERWTGYVVGGISPFGQKRRLPVYLDETALVYDRVLVSAGRRGLQVELASQDLIRLLDAGVGDLTSAGRG